MFGFKNYKEKKKKVKVTGHMEMRTPSDLYMENYLFQKYKRSSRGPVIAGSV